MKKLLAVARQLHQYVPAIVRSPQAAQKTPFDEPIDELHRAVMLKLHSLRQGADRRFNAIGQTSDPEQKLMLLWFYSRLACGGFTETEEAADLVAELRHGFEIG